MKEGDWKLRIHLHNGIINFIDQWRREHEEARFITDDEVPKILNSVSMEFVRRHHKRRTEGLNKYGEYL